MKKMQGAKIMQDVKIMQGAKKIQRTKNIQRAIHVYQMTVGKVVIFYTLQDFLVFYTIFSTYARKHGMTILGLALMYNHIHVLIAADSRTEIRSFVSGYSSRFVRDYNADAGRKGPLFNMQFGSAVKYGAKNIRTAAGYLYNNHTNKKLCGKAQDIRWNFLAYAHNNHPFSEPIIIRKASFRLKQALEMVKAQRKADNYLNYTYLKRLYSDLKPSEKEQLTDFIISSYNAVDYTALEQFYRSYEEMLYSFNANTFAEYDLPEDASERRGDDRVYNHLAELVLSSGRYEHLKDILILPDIEKIKLASELRAKSGVSYKQIGAFLQYKIITTPEKISRKEVMEAEKMIEESKNFLKNTQTWN